MKNSLILCLFYIFLVMGQVFINACTRVRVNGGPFPIDFDMERIAEKSQFLDMISEASPVDSLPNIVLILVDDLGKYDISTYDPKGVPTPAIDKLALNGVKFTSAYSTSSVCSPSRASLMTGRYQQRFGYERQPMNRYPKNRMEYWIVDRFINTDPMQLITPMSRPGCREIKKQGIPPDEILLSEILKKRGYQTGIFGKWHLGYHESFIPNNRGFDEQYGFYEAFTHYASENDPGIINYRHDYFANKHIWRQKRKGTCALRENNKVIEENNYLTLSIAAKASSFIDQHRKSPFFLYIPFSAPHTPFQVPVEYYNRFNHVKDENKKVYYGMISALDDAIEIIMEKLQEHQLTEQTFIVFASDNGGATYTGATDNGILKAGKFSQFEGGINIPMIFSWKGVLPEGSVYSYPVSLMDIFTTAIAITGCELPENRKYDGINLIPFVLRDSKDLPHNFLYWRTDFNKAVRNNAWKLIWNDRDDQVFLYNLEKDPSELFDISNLYKEKVEELKRKLLEWETEMMNPKWPGVMQFRFDIDNETTWWAI